MTREEQLHLITRKCVGANPDIVEVTPNQDAYGGFDPSWKPRTIRLSDVLLATDKTAPSRALVVSMTGRFYEYNPKISAYPDTALARWDIRKDDLTEQSEVCITFLADLLK